MKCLLLRCLRCYFENLKFKSEWFSAFQAGYKKGECLTWQDWVRIHWPRKELQPGWGLAINPCRMTWLLCIYDEADSNQRVGILKRWHQTEWRFLEETQISAQSIGNLSILYKKCWGYISGRVKCPHFRGHFKPSFRNTSLTEIKLHREKGEPKWCTIFWE